MPTDEFDSLWKEFNSLEVEDLLHYTNVSILSKLIHIAPEDKKNNLEKELELGWLIHIFSNWLDHFDSDFDKASNEITNFTTKHKNDLNYYQTRLKESKTTLLKWHYSIACYFLDRGSYLSDTLNLILKSAKISLESKQYLNCVELLVLVYNLNKIYNTKFDEKINQNTSQFIEELKNHPRYLIEPSEVIARIGLVGGQELTDLVDLLVSKGAQEKEDHIFESLLNTAINLCNTKKRDDVKKSIILKLAQRFEVRGDAQTEGLLMIHFYEKAQKEFQRLNDEGKISNLSEKIRQSYNHIQWQKIEHKSEIPILEIPGKNGFEKVKSIVDFADMIPSISKTEKLTDELRQKFPISSLFPSTSFNKKQPTSHSLTDDEIRKSQIRTEYIRTIKMMESILSINVKKLEEKNEITGDSYYDYIKSFGLHDQTSLKIMKQGIKRHFAEDYISSIHILIPQVEYTLRELLRGRGIKTTRIANSIIRNVLLNALISKGTSLYGDDMANYLKIKFTDIDGPNERNNVCHAYADFEDFNHSTSLSIIYVIMKLTNLVIKK